MKAAMPDTIPATPPAMIDVANVMRNTLAF